MRVYISSTPEDLQGRQEAACGVVRSLGLEPLLRLNRSTVADCARQVADADLFLALIARRRDSIPEPEAGGDGLRPWSWWEARSAFNHDRPVLVLMENGTALEDDPRGRAVLQDFRGELDPLAVFFEPGSAQESFQRLVRSQLVEALRAQEPNVGEENGDELVEENEDATDAVAINWAREDPPSRARVRPRIWPSPELPERPYPLLLPYSHPALLAGRSREIREIRQRLSLPVPILGLHAPSGSGKSSLLGAGLVASLRAENRPVAFDRYPNEAGLGRRLLGDLLEGHGEDEADQDPHTSANAFLGSLASLAEQTSELPLLVVDQLEDVLALPPASLPRVELALLLATTVQRRSGWGGPPCRWLLAYRQEAHGQVMRWLGNVLWDVRGAGFEAAGLPHDLAQAQRFQSFALPPLAAPPPGTQDPQHEAARIFQAAIGKPLTQRRSDGQPLYPWRFKGDGAARLAQAFAAARLAQPRAPLAPKLQVVLAHLLERAPQGDDGIHDIEVPEEPAELIEQALEEHVQRALETAFPVHGAKPAELRARRTRALLVLRELADAERGKTGLPGDALALALGAEGDEVLATLASPRCRLVVAEPRGDGWTYSLPHHLLANVIVRLVDEGHYANLGVDDELLRLRRFVVLRSELFAAGDREDVTLISTPQYQRIQANATALLWGNDRKRWWDACRRQWQQRRRQSRLRAVLVLAALLVAGLGAWLWADQRAQRQAQLDQIVSGSPETAFATLDQLTRAGVDESTLLAQLRQRETPFDIFDSGLGGLSDAGPEERGEALLRVAELAWPVLGENPEDPVLIAPLVWAIDFFALPQESLAEEARALRRRILEPLRQRYPPPPLPAPADPAWVTVPAGTFQMGTGPGEGRDEENKLDERPRHAVTLSSFRIQRHEVRLSEYRRLVPDHLQAERPEEDDFPAVMLDWFAAYTYAAWLGGRLPTEFEWESVARYGCDHPYCRRDGTAAELSEVAWWVGNAPGAQINDIYPSPVGRKEPSPLGLYDIHGNAWEWTANWYGAYPADPQVNPTGPTQDPNGSRTFKGGSAFETAEWVVAGGRGADVADGTSWGIGLRVLLPEALLNSSSR